MGYVLTNGQCYIKLSATGKVEKTHNLEDAHIYPTMVKAKHRLETAKGKTRGYYIYDLESELNFKVYGQRIKYPEEVRRMLYNNAGGRCQLCGRRILFEDMTIDHIQPLSMGGADSVKNLQCADYSCNCFKGNILPEDFYERIRIIFMYQMKKKYKKSIRWKIIHRLLNGMS